jgi:hypothetical protein
MAALRSPRRLDAVLHNDEHREQEDLFQHEK